MGLPKGYETVLAEAATASRRPEAAPRDRARRAFLEPAILLLDDPTAAIDSETEHEIFDALDRRSRAGPRSSVAHRLSTLRRADMIIVLGTGASSSAALTGADPGSRAVPARAEPPARRQPRAQSPRGGRAMSADRDRGRKPDPRPAGARRGRRRGAVSSRSTGGFIRRILTYARPGQAQELATMVALTIIRSVSFGACLDNRAHHQGPIAHGDLHGIYLGTLSFAALRRHRRDVPLPPAHAL